VSAPGREPRVLVTDASRGSALAVIRSLGRRGCHVVAADAGSVSPGARSRYASGRVRYPSPFKDPAGMLDALEATIRRRGIDLLVPVTDDVIVPLVAERSRFEALCGLVLPRSEALELAADKAATLGLARSVGVPVPETIVADGATALADAASRLRWPVVLKPSRSRVVGPDGRVERRAVTYAADADELAALAPCLAGWGPVVVQPWLPGSGVGVEVLADHGRPVALFQHRRLHEVPITGGASSLRVSEPLDPDLAGHATRLLAEMSWHGLAMVEFRVGPDGPVLMEVNGRIWGSMPLAVASGVDFPGQLLDVWLDRTPRGTRIGEYRAGVVGRNLELEVVWIASTLRGERRLRFLPTPRRRAALAGAAGLLDPRVRDDIVSRSDPLPGLVELLRIGLKLIRKASAR
jgi:predicted ATP-grasp superfamily ATP-dependent carboligase